MEVTTAKFGVGVLKASMLKWLGVQSAIGIYALFYIYTPARFDVVVLKAYMLDCKGVICHRYISIVLYLYRSARFGVAVFKASMLDWLGDICQVWCNNIQGNHAQVMGGSICHGYMCIVLYIYIYRSAKFGVVVLKAFMLDWLGDICQVWCNNIQGNHAQVMGGQSAMGICALFYIYRSAKFGVVVLKASMLDWLGGHLP